GKKHGGAVRAQAHICFRGILADVGIPVDAHTDAPLFCAVNPGGREPALPFLLPAKALCAPVHCGPIVNSPVGVPDTIPPEVAASRLDEILLQEFKGVDIQLLHGKAQQWYEYAFQLLAPKTPHDT